MDDSMSFEEWYKQNRFFLGELPVWMEEQIKENYLRKWETARQGMIDENKLIPGTNATIKDTWEIVRL